MSNISNGSLEKRATLKVGYENDLSMFVIGLQQLLGEYQLTGDFEEDQGKIGEDETVAEASVLDQGKSFFQLVERMEDGKGETLVDERIFGNIVLQFVGDLLDYKIHVYSLQLMKQTNARVLEEALPPPVKQGVLKRGRAEKITFSPTGELELGEGPINTPWWILIQYLE